MHLLSAFVLTLLTPLSFAYAAAAPGDFASLVAIVIGIIKTLIVLVFTLTFLVIIWGVVKGWIIGGGEAEGIESGKNTLFAGIVALVVMLSIWGILEILKSSLFG